MYFDTHAHLYDERYDDDFDSVIGDIKASDVTLVMNVSSDTDTSYKTVSLTEKYPFIYGAVGVHPHEADKMTDSDIDILKSLSRNEKIRAIGEIGLDYHFDFSPRDVQKRRFEEQLLLARELGLPVIVHDRDAHGDCLDILRDFTDLKVVYHCYSGSPEYAKIITGLGFYLSFTGAITFKNAKTAPEVISRVPLDRIMIETDSPYLTPEPFRGKRNSPLYVTYVARKIAEILGMTQEEIARITSDNGRRFFGME
ncbi:MAG: TatD family hydrolase [Clostridiales bacterium]|jgi:TatD DNase family protein|nr:TatD family hydrolase [Clostridiales bacterium]